MDINDLTLGQLRELQAMGNPSCEGSFIKPGECVFIRTVTHHYTGKVEAVSATEIKLSSAAWIASDGRFADALASGDFAEVEPYPDDLFPIIGRGAILDITVVPFTLPRSQK